MNATREKTPATPTTGWEILDEWLHDIEYHLPGATVRIVPNPYDPLRSVQLEINGRIIGSTEPNEETGLSVTRLIQRGVRTSTNELLVVLATIFDMYHGIVAVPPNDELRRATHGKYGRGGVFIVPGGGDHILPVQDCPCRPCLEASEKCSLTERRKHRFREHP